MIIYQTRKDTSPNEIINDPDFPFHETDQFITRTHKSSLSGVPKRFTMACPKE